MYGSEREASLKSDRFALIFSASANGGAEPPPQGATTAITITSIRPPTEALRPQPPIQIERKGGICASLSTAFVLNKDA